MIFNNCNFEEREIHTITEQTTKWTTWKCSVNTVLLRN